MLGKCYGYKIFHEFNSWSKTDKEELVYKKLSEWINSLPSIIKSEELIEDVYWFFQVIHKKNIEHDEDNIKSYYKSRIRKETGNNIFLAILIINIFSLLIVLLILLLNK